MSRVIRRFTHGCVYAITICILAWGTPHASAQTSCVATPDGVVYEWNGNTGQIPGKVGQAVRFNGYGSIHNTHINLPKKGTIEAWVKFTSLYGIQGILGTHGTANGNDRLWLTMQHHGKLVANLGSCCANEIMTTRFLTVDEWWHIALTFDYHKNLFSLFVNGEFIAFSPANRKAPTMPLSLGGFGSDFRQQFHLDGGLDEVVIYNRPLTDAEIENIYQAGSAGKCKKGCSSTVNNIKELREEVAALDTSRNTKAVLNRLLTRTQQYLNIHYNKIARRRMSDFISRTVSRSHLSTRNRHRIEGNEANHLACGAANVLTGISF